MYPERETLFLSIYEYMEVTFPVPKLTPDNKDVVRQVIMQRVAIEYFLERLLDDLDVPPEKTLLELEICFENEAMNHDSKKGHDYFVAWQALSEIDGAFFSMGGLDA